MRVYVQCMVFLMLVICGESGKFLPTMSDEEAATILGCVSNSCNQELCDSFKECGKKMTKRVRDADTKCLKEYDPDAKNKCDAQNTLYPSDEVRNQVLKCINDSLTEELSDPENEEMKVFEACARKLYERCKVLPKCRE